MRCSNWLRVALVGSVVLGRMAFAQQNTTTTLAKQQEFKQTANAAPVQIVNPFTLRLDVTTGTTLSSATVTTPSSNVINLSGSGGSFAFLSSPFASVAALNSTFPNGQYTFTLKTSAGGTITTQPTINGDTYPAAPTITNTAASSSPATWVAGALQFNPTLQFSFTWNQPSATDISFTIRDANGAIVYNPALANGATGVTMPANTLSGGARYSAQLTFNNTTRQSIPLGGGTLTTLAQYSTITNFTINPVTGSPGLITPNGIVIIQGQPMVYQLIANTNANYSADTATLSSFGLQFDAATGIIYGTPTKSGTFQPSYGITNEQGSNGGTINMDTGAQTAGPSFANATSATGHVGTPFRFQIVTTGANNAATFSAIGLPPGLAINANTGLISGTPTRPGSDAVEITLTDGSFTRTTTIQFTFVADPVTPEITSAKRVTLYPGQSFSYQITAAFGSNRVDTPDFKVLGTLPTGLNFDPKTGVISGVFGGHFEREGSPPDQKFLNDSPLVQLAATNTHGTGTSPLVFLAAPTGTVNLSTRMFVGTNDDVLIGGFIITGNGSEKVLLRGIGPSLPVNGAVQDPVLELHLGDGTLQTADDNWQDDATQAQAIKDAGVPPSDNRESALVATFQPANFTAIVRGKNSTTGVGLVELFDLGTVTQDTSQHGKLAQISTRGTVQTGDNVMIGGFIVQGVATKVLLRGIGPELTAKGVTGALQDTIIELHGGDGTLLASNDDWKTTQESEIQATGVPPTDDRESALIATLNPGNYTAVLRGKNDTTGVALVEVYNLQ